MMKSIFFLALAALAAAAPSDRVILDDGATPNPNEVHLKSISYGGTGCPQGSVGSSFSDDRTSFTLLFDAFVASSGPGVAVTEGRKNCQLALNIHVPNGFSYSVATFDYRGYVQLPAGVSAEQKSTYYFQGEQLQASGATRFAGPVAKDYLSRDTIPLAAMVWSKCNKVVPININAQVRLLGAGPGKQAQITTDSIDGKVQHILGLQFRKC